jgi:putative aldouronate transport system permease protein
VGADFPQSNNGNAKGSARMGKSKSDYLIDGTIYAVLLLFAFVTLYPFWNSLVLSLNVGSDTARGGITFWPRQFTLENYAVVFRNDNIYRAFFITILRTLVGTALSIFFTAMLAYGLSKRVVGRRFYMLVCIVTLYFSGGLIPTYVLIRDLQLMNTFWVMVIPGMVNVFHMIIFRTFFLSLPTELEDAARIDGCSNLGVFFRVVLPLSGPVIATLGLFTAVYHWNEWFTASIYISDERLMPLQTILAQAVNSNLMSEQLAQAGGAASAFVDKIKQSVTTKSLLMSTMIVATLPIIFVYPFIQKYFAKGVMIGSLKE